MIGLSSVLSMRARQKRPGMLIQSAAAVCRDFAHLAITYFVPAA